MEAPSGIGARETLAFPFVLQFFMHAVMGRGVGHLQSDPYRKLFTIASFFTADLWRASGNVFAMRKLLFLVAFALVTGARADDLASLQGKWTVKKTGDRGGFTQHLEFKDKKFTFKIVNSEDAVVFVATGEVE